MRPRVVIDVALLGWAHQKKSYARGVHRVAEQIVSGLIETNECDLQFVATSSLAGAFRALAEKGSGWEKKLIYRPYQFTLSRWAERIWVWIERTLPDRRLHMRGLRWLLHRFARWADSAAKRIPRAALRDADIYHSPLSPIPRAVQVLPGIKKFLTIVDVIPLSDPATVAGKGVPFLQKQLDSLKPDSFAFCISETVKNDLLRIKNMPPGNVFVTPLAASPKVFFPVTDRAIIQTILKAHRIPDTPYFLTLSSFDPRKNFEHIIRCFDQTLRSGALAKCNLVIVGSNPEQNRQVDHALGKLQGTRESIIVPGFVPDHDLAALYSGAIAFLFPSLSEGFGIPVLEAMQCGAPVISSNATALPEVVGQAGMLLDPRNIDAWSEAMVRIASDSNWREELACRALERARDFSWNRFIHATIDGYRSSLKQPRALSMA